MSTSQIRVSSMATAGQAAAGVAVEITTGTFGSGKRVLEGQFRWLRLVQMLPQSHLQTNNRSPSDALKHKILDGQR
jgi:hypothetical protein